MRKSSRKKINWLVSLLLIPVLFLYVSPLSPIASADLENSVEGILSLDADELFTEAKQDLEALGDLNTAEQITVSDGQDVNISSSGIWVLEGTASDVTVYVDAPDDAIVVLLLKDLIIENRDCHCIYIGSAGKVYILPVADSSLTVSEEFRKDPDRKGKAVIYSRTDLTLSGDALLTIDSSKNGIDCKDKLRFIKGDYTITAASKSIGADNAIWIGGGNFRLKAGTDALHAENEDDTSQGSIYIGGGIFDISAGDDGIHGQTLVQIDDGSISVAAADGIESTRVLINGGTIDIRATGDGINAGFKDDVNRPKIEIAGGEISITMTGEDPDAVDSNADLIISGGSVSVTGAGIDCDGDLDFSGGTVIIEGQTVSEIPNASTHSLQ